MAEWIADLQKTHKQPIHVLEVEGLPGSTPATHRHIGMMQRLEEIGGVQPHIESVMGEWYRENAYDVVSAFLRTHKDVDAIVAQNDLMATGALEAVRDSKNYEEGSVHIMGVDGIMLGVQAVADGVIECTATYASRGDMVIETAYRILSDMPFMRDTVLPTTMIDEMAAKAMLIKNDYFTIFLHICKKFCTFVANYGTKDDSYGGYSCVGRANDSLCTTGECGCGAVA